MTWAYNMDFFQVPKGSYKYCHRAGAIEEGLNKEAKAICRRYFLGENGHPHASTKTV